MSRVKSLRLLLNKQLYDIKAAGGKVIGIGAATKGNTLLNYKLLQHRRRPTGVHHRHIDAQDRQVDTWQPHSYRFRRPHHAGHYSRADPALEHRRPPDKEAEAPGPQIHHSHAGVEMKKHIEINHSDDRGTIRDIFVSSPKDHCSIITFTPNAVPGNHFHKESTQYAHVVDGEILLATRLIDQNGEPAGEVEQVVIGPGDLVTHPPYPTILAFADGVRGGSDYERDVFRLKDSLV